MGRPAGYQWEPLGLDTDPVPGDPAVVSQDSSHLSSVASEIEGQVAALRRIAGSSENIGQTADKIRSAASEIVGELAEVATRYQKVAAALAGWGPELEQAQNWSLQALDEAEAPYAAMKNTPVPAGVNVVTGLSGLPELNPFPPQKLTSTQQQDFASYRSTLQRAQGELAAAQALLNRATSLRDDKANYYAGLINNASNDGLTDSFWDRFKSWVSQYAWLIKDICTVLEVVATILAIVALFIPGVNIVAALLWIGFALTATALVGRTMLAMTGNGSWFDVAMDAFALLTFGIGKFASGALEALSEAGGKLGQATIDSERAALAEKLLDPVDELKGVLTDDEYSSVLKGMQAIAKGMAKDAIPDIGKFSGKLTLLTSAFLKIGGDADDVENLEKLTAVSERFGSDVRIADMMSGATKAVRLMGLNAGVSFVAGVGVPAVGGVGIDNSQGNPVTVGGVPLNVQIPDNITTHIYNDIEHRTTAGIPDSVGTEAFNIAFYAGL
jgi:hypothetical protein